MEDIRSNLERIVGYFLIVCISIGIILHIIPYIYNKSLWVDEGMLTSSICTRTIKDLVASPLDFGQSSPIGWLYIVKILTMLFGSSEATLRLWSLIALFGCMILTYLLLDKKVRHNYVLFIVAIFSLTNRFIYYGNEIKPYMSDNMFCLLTLFLWQKYKERKIAFWNIVLAFSLIIWFSFSAIFFIAACMIIESYQALKKIVLKKESYLLRNLELSIFVLASFLLNYTVWLRNTSVNAGEKKYWELLSFPLLPSSMKDIKLIWKMSIQFWAFYPKIIAALFVLLIAMYFIICVIEKRDISNLVIPYVVSLMIVLVASSLGFYPIQDRLVQIYQLVGIIIVGYACDNIDQVQLVLFDKTKLYRMQLFYYGILAGCLAIVGIYGCKYFFPQNVYKSGSAVRECVNWLRENSTSDDIIYVYRSSLSAYLYYSGYEVTYSELNDFPPKVDKSTQILPALPLQIGSTIYGQSLITRFYQEPYSYDSEDNAIALFEDANLIVNHRSVYLFTSDGEMGVPRLLEILDNYGNIEVIVDSYDTHLYHFVRN